MSKPKRRVARGAGTFAGVGIAAAEWYGATVRGLEALAFLERSSDMAAEAVIATSYVLQNLDFEVAKRA